MAHRESLAISQVQMAKKLKLTSQKLCDFEKGRRLPSPEVAEKWALALKLSTKVWAEAVLKEQIVNCKTINDVHIKPVTTSKSRTVRSSVKDALEKTNKKFGRTLRHLAK